MQGGLGWADVMRDWSHLTRGYACRLVWPGGRDYLEDEAEVRRVLRNTPMQGSIAMTFAREPSFFEPSAQPGCCYPFLVSSEPVRPEPAGPEPVQSAQADARETVTLCALSSLPVYIDGRPAESAYLHLLRVPEAARGRINALRAGYAAMKAFKDALGLAGPCFTSIAADNAPARRLLEAGVKGLPHYRPSGALNTRAFSVRLGREGGLLRPATEADIPELVAFYAERNRNTPLAPCLDEAWFRELGSALRPELRIQDFLLLRAKAGRERGGAIIGSLALWDRRATRQNIIAGYSPLIRQARLFYNALAHFLRRPPLPAMGAVVPSLFLAFPAFAEDGGKLAVPCIREALALAGKRGCAMALMGLRQNGPNMAGALRGVSYGSTIYTVHWPDEPVERDGIREAFPEVALL